MRGRVRATGKSGPGASRCGNGNRLPIACVQPAQTVTVERPVGTSRLVSATSVKPPEAF